MNGNVRPRSDFSADIGRVLNDEQLKKLKKELGLPEEDDDPKVAKAMPAVKDKMRKEIVSKLKNRHLENVSPENIQDMLRASAVKDVDEPEIV